MRGAGGGGGQTAWYRLPQFAAFLLEGAYTNGNNRDACQNVGTQCIVGKFVKFVVSGQVGPGTGGGSTGSSVIGVQLIE